MQHSKIEWLGDPITGKAGYSINPVKGLCPMDCRDNQGKSYCYARRMYKRFKWNPEIRFSPKAIDQLARIKQPSRIFWGSTIELFGDWVKYWWMKTILDMCLMTPQHTHIFLTKQPQNLIKWTFPENCWVGVTATDFVSSARALYTGFGRIEATAKFISFEPLFGETKLRAEDLKDVGINWLIIGQKTPISAKTQPKKIWIDEIIEAVQKAGIPYFLKDNLKPIMGDNLMQDFPKGVDLAH